MQLGTDAMVAAMVAFDRAFDGQFLVAVKTTKIYCLPSCRPPRKPKPENCAFYETPAQARAAGFRACKLCRPDRLYAADGGVAQIERESSRQIYLDSADSPAGPLAFAVKDDGALVWTQFLDGAYERTMEEELTRGGFGLGKDRQRTARARAELTEYATGARRHFTLPLALGGTPWQRAVWRALTTIPYGETRTYAQVAALIGRAGGAARAVGRANATNHLPLVVPCHRVLGADGALTGFAGGTAIKARLLEHEARVRNGGGASAASRINAP